MKVFGLEKNVIKETYFSEVSCITLDEATG